MKLHTNFDRSRNLPEAFARPLGDPSTWPAELREWGEDIRRERDPELFFHGLFWIAHRAENHHPEWAGKAYSLIAQSEFSGPLGKRAERRLNALTGRGWSAEHWEVAGTRFATALTDPVPLLAFAGGTLAFRSVRWWAANRLAAAETATLLTRGRGLAWGANVAGFAAESTAFPLTFNLLKRAGSENSPELAATWAQSALFLGAIRLTGGLSSGVAEKWTKGARPVGRLTGQALQNAGLYGGILLGHHLSDAAAGRTGENNPWIQGLAEWFQIRITSHWIGRLGPDPVADLPLPRRTGYFPGIFPQPAWISAGGPSPPVPNVMLMAGPAPVTYAHPTSGFASVKTIRSPIGKGQSFLDIGTRKAFTKEEHARLLIDLEDGFSSLLNGFSTREAKLFRGPVSALFRSDKTLRRDFLDHLDDKKNRLWGLIDADTGFIQRLVALDGNGRPKMVLALGVKNPSNYEVLSLSLEHRRPEWPEISAKQFIFKEEKFEKFQKGESGISQYNGIPRHQLERPDIAEGISQASELNLTVFAGLPHQLTLKLSRLPDPRWELRNQEGRVLFQVTPSGREGMHIFQWSAGEHVNLDREQLAFEVHREKILSGTQETAPSPSRPKRSQLPRKVKAAKQQIPLPLKSGGEKARPLEPPPKVLPPPPEAKTQPKKIPKPAEPPPKIEQPDLEVPGNLIEAKKLLKRLNLVLEENLPKPEAEVIRLKRELFRLNPEEFEEISSEIETQLPAMIRRIHRAENLTDLLLARLDPQGKLRRSLQVANLLNNPNPPILAGSFEFFRKSLSTLSHRGLMDLNTHIEKNIKPQALAPRNRMMVQQVLSLIRDALGQNTPPSPTGF